MKIRLTLFLALPLLALAANKYGIYDSQGSLVSEFEAERSELPEKTRRAKNSYPSKKLYVSLLKKGKGTAKGPESSSGSGPSLGPTPDPSPIPIRQYRFKTGSYVEAGRNETFSICPPDKKTEGIWISEHSVALNEKNCLSVQAPNLAGSFDILFMENSGRTDTVQVLVEQSYIQMGDYSHKVWVSAPEAIEASKRGDFHMATYILLIGQYESKDYTQNLIVDKTMLTMGDAMHYYKMDTAVITHWTFGRDEYKNIKLEESSLPLVGLYSKFRIANLRSKMEGLDTAYISVHPRSKEAEGLVLLGNPSSYSCERCTVAALDTSASGYRAPFSEEWAILMRAGASTKYYWGNEEDSLTVSRYAWIKRELKPVAQLVPNRFGLYDMMGIAKEGCHGEYDYFEQGSFSSWRAPECRFLQNQNYYNSFRLMRKTPKLQKLEKF